MRHLAILGAAVAVLGCASQDLAAETGRNPFNLCRAEGLSPGAAPFADCIDAQIVAQCTAAGHTAGSAAYDACERRLRDTVFVANFLDLHGYRVGFDLYSFN